MVKLVIVTLVLSLASAVASAEPPKAQDIVEAADRARNPQQPFRMTLTLVDYERARARDRVVLAVYAKIDNGTRQFRNLVRYVDPPRDAGKLALLDAGKMWFYDPASKTSVRISPQQRLTGQASNGDVLTVNLARDYASKVVGEETLEKYQVPAASTSVLRAAQPKQAFPSPHPNFSRLLLLLGFFNQRHQRFNFVQHPIAAPADQTIDVPVATFKRTTFQVIHRLAQHKCAGHKFAADKGLAADVDGLILERLILVLRQQICWFARFLRRRRFDGAD